ncbi:hypothetical protein G6011_07506 [Alternaria panax]|uniref:Uncharacterized protein n=1 Tax=Alternaria panax TaxID=48097 RepID=A0AAD4I935_9PLEO|nr:hypothetical protein G6011_07506 [Alternaria panax]
MSYTAKGQPSSNTKPMDTSMLARTISGLLDEFVTNPALTSYLHLYSKAMRWQRVSSGNIQLGPDEDDLSDAEEDDDEPVVDESEDDE